MAIRSDEIISILKSQIAGFDGSAETRTGGTGVEVGDGIAQIYGLSGALSSELLEFPGGVAGMALNLGEETVGAVLLGDFTEIREGDTVKRSGCRIPSILWIAASAWSSRVCSIVRTRAR